MEDFRRSGVVVSFVAKRKQGDAPAGKQKDGCKRSSTRRRVLKGALAAFCNRQCTINCTVIDISATGARIRCDGSMTIPDTFELLIELDGLEGDCEVVWRRGVELGVRFLGAPRRVEPRRHQVVNQSVPEAKRRIQSKSVSAPPAEQGGIMPVVANKVG